jgi:hypothetical protein
VPWSGLRNLYSIGMVGSFRQMACLSGIDSSREHDKLNDTGNEKSRSENDIVI